MAPKAAEEQKAGKSKAEKKPMKSKAEKMPVKEGSKQKKKSKKSIETYKIYIYKVLKQVGNALPFSQLIFGFSRLGFAVITGMCIHCGGFSFLKCVF